MLTFQSERWSAIVEELKPLFDMNWLETALDHDRIPLDVNYARYAELDAANAVQVTTARTEARELVGYFIFFTLGHPHYQKTLFGFMDAFFLHPVHRSAGNGIRMFMEAERALAARGVVSAIANTKISHDASAIFERLKWRKTAITYTKLLGGEHG